MYGPAPKFPPRRGTPVVMQRWMLLRSSGPVLNSQPLSTAASRASAAAVRAGMRPSGGSTISDVRSVNVTSIMPIELLVDQAM